MSSIVAAKKVNNALLEKILLYRFPYKCMGWMIPIEARHHTKPVALTDAMLQ